ncbi:MAG: hypothetical protein RL189_493 [Pseudomonadota bacterium]|jgi:hypothetical protein
MKEKINSKRLPSSATTRLLLRLRPSEVVTSERLRGEGISARLATYLKDSGTLLSLGVGAYVRGHDKPSFASAIAALLHQLKLPLHIGGRTALELQGVSQYLRLGSGQIAWIFVFKKTKLPLWFTKQNWDTIPKLIQTKFLKQNISANLRTVSVDGFEIQVSRRELAILETIFLIGKSHRFEEVDELFGTLTTLDASVLQKLLESCQSIRVARIFLYLAHKHEHPWIREIDESKIELGRGKRAVVKGGKLDARYQITVPADEVEPDV